MATSDIIGGGNIEPRGLEEEMRSSYLDYAMSVIVGRALPDVRDGLKPVHRRVLFSMNENGLQPNRPYAKCAAHRRRRDGQVPPARRLGDLRHARPARAGLLACATRSSTARATSARSTTIPPAAMRYTEARLAPLARGDAARPRRRHGRLPAQLRRRAAGADGPAGALPEPARQRLVAASPSAWRRTSRRTTCARRSRRPSPTSTTRTSTSPGLMQHIKGPDFPTGGVILGLDRHPRGLRDRPRPRPRAGARAHRADSAQGKEAIIVTELPFMVKKGGDSGLIRKIAELVQREEDHRDLRPARRVRPQGHADRDRAQARRRSRRSCSTSSTSTRRCRRRSA